MFLFIENQHQYPASLVLQSIVIAREFNTGMKVVPMFSQITIYLCENVIQIRPAGRSLVVEYLTNIMSIISTNTWVKLLPKKNMFFDRCTHTAKSTRYCYNKIIFVKIPDKNRAKPLTIPSFQSCSNPSLFLCCHPSLFLINVSCSVKTYANL